MVLESFEHRKVMCDPYDDSIGYSIPEEEIDIVTISHFHFDHCGYDFVKGDPAVVSAPNRIRKLGIIISGMESQNNTAGKNKKESNIIFKIQMDNINFVHLGDIDKLLSPDEIDFIKPCDILAVPAGGTYTIDCEGAFKIAQQLSPQIVVPIHYYTPSNKMILDDIDKLISKFIEVKNSQIWEGTRKDIPKQQVLWILEPLGEKKV